MDEQDLTRMVSWGGVEFQVVSDAAMLRQRTQATKPIQLCMRVAETVVPPVSADHAARREQHPCERCGQLCWFDPKAGPGRLFVTLLCLECVCIEAQS